MISLTKLPFSHSVTRSEITLSFANLTYQLFVITYMIYRRFLTYFSRIDHLLFKVSIEE